jgi:hypothetical protein
MYTCFYHIDYSSRRRPFQGLSAGLIESIGGLKFEQDRILARTLDLFGADTKRPGADQRMGTVISWDVDPL